MVNAAVSIWHLGPDVWAAIATWVGACVALAAGIAVATIGRSQLAEARRLRREQAQPYVVVFAQESDSGPWNIDLVIKNFGETAATDVRVTFSAPLDSAVLRTPPSHSPIKTPEVIPVLVPGQEWRTFWDSTQARDEAKDLPQRYTATVVFSDSHRRPVDAHYEFVIDWQVLLDRGFVQVYNVHHIADALRDIRDDLRRVKSHHGLNVVVRDGDAMDGRDRKSHAYRVREHRLSSGQATRVEVISSRLHRLAMKLRSDG